MLLAALGRVHHPTGHSRAAAVHICPSHHPMSSLGQDLMQLCPYVLAWGLDTGSVGERLPSQGRKESSVT